MSGHEPAAARLEEIRKKREALLGAAGARELFGESWDAWQAQHRASERKSEVDLIALEEVHAITFPDEYRAFVLGVADGGMGPGCGLFDVSTALADAPEFTGQPSTPFPYGDADAAAVLAKRAQRDRRSWLEQPNDDGLPGGCLLLAHTGSGCFDVLVITGEQRGAIWFHDTQRLFPLGTVSRPLHFFDWYDDWVEGCLRMLGERRA